jgi:putative SOS response-associated peptidase YedK
MCGRFSIIADIEALEKRWHATAQQPLWPHYNAAPSQQLPIIINDQIKIIQPGVWGLRPSWWHSKAGLINARAESLRERPSFNNALRQRRCLVLADGFFEWQKTNGRKPFRFTLPNNHLFAFAGIWEPTRDTAGNTLPSFAIITTNANDTVSRVHNRMPVILEPGAESAWLDHGTPLEKELELLHPFTGKMECVQVSNLVNSVNNDTPDVIRPVTAD